MFTQPPSYTELLRLAAGRYGLEEGLLRRVMAAESSGRPRAVSPAGAVGLMQLIPSTYAEVAQREGLGEDPFNPQDNVLAGAAYLRDQLSAFKNPRHALAAYNWGPGNVKDWVAAGADESKLPKETQDYLRRVDVPLPAYRLRNDPPAWAPTAVVAPSGGPQQLPPWMPPQVPLSGPMSPVGGPVAAAPAGPGAPKARDPILALAGVPEGMESLLGADVMADARNQTLLGLGLGLLAGAGPKQGPRNIGADLLQALQAGQSLGQGAIDRPLKAAMTATALKKAALEAKGLETFQKMVAGEGGPGNPLDSLSTEQKKLIASLPPEQGLQVLTNIASRKPEEGTQMERALIALQQSEVGSPEYQRARYILERGNPVYVPNPQTGVPELRDAPRPIPEWVLERERAAGYQAPAAMGAAAPAPQVSLSASERADYRKQIKSVDELNRGFDLVEELVSQTGVGPGTMIGRKGGNLSSAYTDLLMRMKNVYELGAITGPDQAILESVIVDPRSWEAWWKGVGTPEFFLGQVETLRGVVERNRDAIEKALGGAQVPGTGSQSQQPQSEDLYDKYGLKRRQ